MRTPLRRAKTRAASPQGEVLEGRQLLSGVVTGLDQQGDLWALRLIGPGSLRVQKQPDASGNPSPLYSETAIDTITVAGTDSLKTKLVGKILKLGPNSNGQIYFQDFEELGGKALSESGDQGINVIDMPNFWLANTSANPGATTLTGQSSSTKAVINIPDGVNTLKFGGANVNVFLGTNAANALVNQTGFVQLAVNLGIPQYHGSSIIVDQIVTNGETASGSTTNNQQGVTFNVTGRLNSFQANQIVGNANVATTPFQGGGGTLVVAQPLTAGSIPVSAGGTVEISGELGAVRVGGNATNFSVQSYDKSNTTYIGGETNNFSLLSPGGSRDLYFGRGLDNSTISTHVIQNLQANRGAVGSRVVVDRQIGRAVFGGDVLNSEVLSGYYQNLTNIFDTQSAGATPMAELGGGQTDLIAGSVQNSYFTASVAQSSDGTFGGTDNLKLPSGHIKAKVEGVIDNSSASTTAPTVAFLAKQVSLKTGPVIPPNVPSPPFGLNSYHQQVGGATGLEGTQLEKFFNIGKTKKFVERAHLLKKLETKPITRSGTKKKA